MLRQQVDKLARGVVRFLYQAHNGVVWWKRNLLLRYQRFDDLWSCGVLEGNRFWQWRVLRRYLRGLGLDLRCWGLICQSSRVSFTFFCGICRKCDCFSRCGIVFCDASGSIAGAYGFRSRLAVYNRSSWRGVDSTGFALVGRCLASIFRVAKTLHCQQDDWHVNNAT